MAIKPTDIPSLKDRKLIDQAEKEFDAWLLKNFTGEDLYVASLPDCLPFNYRQVLLDRYREAGWRVYFKENWGDSMGSSGSMYFGGTTATKPPAESQ